MSPLERFKIKSRKRAIFLARDLVDLLARVFAPGRRDELYLKFMVLWEGRRWPRTDKPRRFSDYLIKTLFEKRDAVLKAFVTDKELAKIYVKGIEPSLKLPATYSVLRSREEIAAFEFPIPCAIKGTHSSGEVVLHRGGSLDRDRIVRMLHSSHYRSTREPNYRHLDRKVIVEELLIDADGSIPKDYKLFCFFGEPKLILVDLDRFGTHTRAFYSIGWVRLGFSTKFPLHRDEVPAPANLWRLLAVARNLAQAFRHIRVDCYLIGEAIYLGELTHLHGGGREPFVPSTEVDYRLAPLFEDPDADPVALLGLR